MTEKNLLNASIDVYLSRQESLILEFVRKALQAETKVVMLEDALNQTKQKLEALEAQNASCSSTLDQSIVGLQALQVEKEQYKNEASKLSAYVAELRYSAEIEQDLKQTIQRLRTELETKKSNYTATLTAYDKVSEQLAETTKELNALKSQKQPKTKAKIKGEWSQ